MRAILLRGSGQTALVIVVAVFAFFSVSAGGRFLTGANLEDLARQVSLDAPIVFGEAIVLIVGGIDISVGATMAMAAALAIGLQPYGVACAVAAALLFGIGVGAVNGLLVIKGRIVAFVATLGTMSVLQGIDLTYTNQQPLVGQDASFAWWGAGSVGPVPVPLLVALLVAVILGLFLARARAGRSLYAVGGNIDAAYLAGISIPRTQFLAYLISGTLSSLAGVVLAARLNEASIQLGSDTPLLALTAAIIGGASLLGGRGTIAGALLGVIALGALSNGMDLMGIPTYFQIAIKAAVLVAVVAVDAITGNLAARHAPGATAAA